jgi:hypothetical protein
MTHVCKIGTNKEPTELAVTAILQTRIGHIEEMTLVEVTSLTEYAITEITAVAEEILQTEMTLVEVTSLMEYAITEIVVIGVPLRNPDF